MQDINSDEEFQRLICSSGFEFILDCGITKPTVNMSLADRDMVVSAVSLHHAVLGSLAELEQLRRGLQTARFYMLLEDNKCLFKPLFRHQNKPITSNFIQDFFEVDFSERGSNNRLKEESIMMNWVTYLQYLEGCKFLCELASCMSPCIFLFIRSS